MCETLGKHTNNHCVKFELWETAWGPRYNHFRSHVAAPWETMMARRGRRCWHAKHQSPQEGYSLDFDLS